MMAEELWASSRITCGEDIALLTLLNRVPSPPSDVFRHQDAQTRSLSADRECSLARSLAFLAKLSNDPNHVIAVAVEEASEPKAIRVLIAINKNRPGDGDHILNRIKLGLESIFNVLARAGLDGSVNTEKETLSAIVSMTRNQILLRISSRRSETHGRKGRAFFGDVLQTVNGVVRRRRDRQRRVHAQLFLEKSAVLKDSLDALEICHTRDVDEKLKAVVTAARRLNRAVDVTRLLQGILPRDLNPSTREGFVRRLEKLAMYRDCSLYLYQTAKAFNLFAKATVVPVSLSAEHLRRIPAKLENTDLLECLSRCSTAAALNFGRLCGKLGTNKSKLCHDFVTDAKKAFNESKVHAEIQILAYYELHPVENPPRTICSNKDACYLCTALIELHGKYRIPKSHGRLYPAWRLPNLACFYGLQTQLNLFLEDEIRSQYKNILGSYGGTVRPMLPNESTILPFSASLSTIVSSARSENKTLPYGPLGGGNKVNCGATEDTKATGSKETTETAAAGLTTGAICTSPPTPPMQRSRTQSTIGEPSSPINEPARPPSPPSSDKTSDVSSVERPPSPIPSEHRSPMSQSSLKTEPGEEVMLIRGQATRCALSSEHSIGRSYSTGGLTIFPELALASASASASAPTRELTIEWLDDTTSPGPVVDVSSLPAAKDIDSNSPNCVLLAYGPDVVRVSVAGPGGQGPG